MPMQCEGFLLGEIEEVTGQKFNKWMRKAVGAGVEGDILILYTR